MSDPSRPIATSSQTVGPFFHFGLTTNQALGRIAPDGVEGERIRLRVGVVDGDGTGVPDALIEVYQADAAGRYGQQPGPSAGLFAGFGRLPTDASGQCVFETIRPGPVPGTDGAVQAAHVNVCLLARGLLRQIYTRIYFSGDAALAADPILSLVPVDRRGTLLASQAADDAATWEITIRLQGEHETVFFDL